MSGPFDNINGDLLYLCSVFFNFKHLLFKFQLSRLWPQCVPSKRVHHHTGSSHEHNHFRMLEGDVSMFYECQGRISIRHVVV